MSSADARSAARLAAAQALYQMEVGGRALNESLADLEAHWIGQEVEGDQYKPAELSLFRQIVRGVLDDQRDIDRALDDTLSQGWPLRRIEALMRAILRAGEFELRSCPQTPARVVIKEYVDLAAAFFEREEAGMINAVLDRRARIERAPEFA